MPLLLPPAKTYADMLAELRSRVKLHATLGSAPALESILTEANDYVFDQLDNGLPWHSTLTVAADTTFYPFVTDEGLPVARGSVREVWIEQGDQLRSPLSQGITHAHRAMTATGTPVLYDTTMTGGTDDAGLYQLEVWPPPDRTYTLHLENNRVLSRFSESTDKPCAPYRLVMAYAIATAKAHYGQADAQISGQAFKNLLTAEKERQRENRRFLPGPAASCFRSSDDCGCGASAITLIAGPAPGPTPAPSPGPSPAPSPSPTPSPSPSPAPTPAPAPGMYSAKIQAEDAILSGIVPSTDVDGYEGAGHSDWMTTGAQAATFQFLGVPAGTYDITIRYYCFTPQTNNVIVNGGSQLKEFNTLGAWTVLTVAGVDLVEGANSIVLTADSGYTFFDWVAITETAAASPAPAPAPAPGVAPSITTAPHPTEWLQAGNATDAYFVDDNRWGAGSTTEGPNPDQYMQEVGRSLYVGPNGEVAFREKWRWPAGTTEVKGFPSIIAGRRPGYYGPSTKPGWERDVVLPSGDTSTLSPSGYTPGTFMPTQLPLASLKAKFDLEQNITPTGEGHLTFDIWLQSAPGQDLGFAASSITHEIMIPLTNWGGYGSHPSGRNPNWYDHSQTIAGKLYHIYITKNSGRNPVTGNWDFAGSGPGGVYPGLQYNFGDLSGNYTNVETGQPRRGWKMIAFVPDAFPVAPGEIDLAAIINYVSTRYDQRGVAWGLGNEYLASVELGVEPVSGEGDLTVFDYRVWRP